MRRIGAAILALCMLFALAACKGEVTKKRKVGEQHQILVVDGGKERWIDVDKKTFDSCQKGEWYEDKKCLANRPTMRNIPVDENGEKPAPEVNPPRRDTGWEYKDRNSRRVCFHWIIVPRQEVEIVWWVNNGGDQFIRPYGNDQKCVYADRGSSVGLTVTSSDERDAPKMVCEIHQETSRGRKLVDFATGIVRKCIVGGRIT